MREDSTPASMDHILIKNDRMYNLRSRNKVVVPRFNSYFMKNSIAHRASIVWNLLTPILPDDYNVKKFISMVNKSKALFNLDFSSESPQTTSHNNDNFIYYWINFNVLNIDDQGFPYHIHTVSLLFCMELAFYLFIFIFKYETCIFFFQSFSVIIN